MKNLLLLTDFSAEANHAAAYAYSLAETLNADLILCNAMMIPSEIPMASLVSWPMVETEDVIFESDKELKKLKAHLEKMGDRKQSHPKIKIINQSGALKDVADSILVDEFVDLTIMGAHGAGGISEFILGSQSRYMIDNFNAPLLLVPLSASIRPIRKIVFATDFYFTESNMEFIYLLTPLAESLGAEIIITHIHSHKDEIVGFDEMVKKFMFELCSKFKSPRIIYRSVESVSAKKGLEQLMLDGQMDMLVMVHRTKSFLSDLLVGSLTKKMASSIDFPLLVFKKSVRSHFLKKSELMEDDLPMSPALFDWRN